jgi:hypothetical protein
VGADEEAAVGGSGIPDEFTLHDPDEHKVDLDTTAELISTSTLTSVSTLQGGAPLKTESALTVTKPLEMVTTLGGAAPIKAEMALDLRPVRAELDIKPLTLDLCLNVGLNSLPATRICTPFSTHFGLTLFGVELIGFNLFGENRVQIEPLTQAPTVAWGGTEAKRSPPRGAQARAEGAPDGGLRIRLTG